MKRPVPQIPAIQLHLPLLEGPTRIGTADPQPDLITALVELLIDAARVEPEDGGDDESEAHR
jgi:hypothetical protein